MHSKHVVCLALTLCLSAATLAQAGDLATVEMSAVAITWHPQVDYERLTLTVSGPGDFYLSRELDAATTPSLSLFDQEGSLFPDGTYSWELRTAPRLSQELRLALAAARASGDPALEAEVTRRVPAGAFQAGYFSILGGELVPLGGKEQPFTLESPLHSAAEPLRNVAGQVVLTNADGVIRNSLCVGFDCPDAPVFSDSTILLMENNTRIKFGDTSNAPFPNNDWEIEANSSLSGGQNYLGFNDCGTADNDGGCATDLVFAVEAGARQNALYVESDGDVGIGTSNPVVDLHVVTGNTPTLRLDQDGSSGFAPQVWDVAGNETNFFIRDVTGGSLLPFRIRPGAPTSSIDIATTGNVGIGTASPANPLHVLRSSGAGEDMFKMTNNAAVRFVMEDTSRDTWTIRNVPDGGTNSAFFINTVPTPVAGPQFEIEEDGDVFVNGALVHSSSRLVKTGFELLDPAEVLSRLAGLEIPVWSYIADDSASRHMGPVAEDFFALFGLGPDDKHIAPSDTAGVALAAIQGLLRRAEDKDQVISDLKTRLAEVEALVERLMEAQD